MLTKRQNLLETIHGGNPDRFVNQYEAFAMQIPNGFSIHNPSPKPGQLNVVNAWGVTRSWPEGTPGAFPVHTGDKIVIKDIEEWQKYLKVPQVVYDAQVWEPFIEAAEKVDRNEQFCTSAVFPGIFEQSHYLLEIQNCLMAFYEYPDEMKEILEQITEFEMQLAKEICKYIKPDALFHHDDWGSQQSTFLSPEMFREFIKPCYMKVYGYYKEHGVELIIHHSDSYAATLVPDMIDMGIDIWQGVMTCNNIPELIKQYGGKISFMGGIDSATIDFPGWTVEDVAREVDRACRECGKLYFIPGASQGLAVSTFPGVYDETTRQIELASKKYF